MQKMLKREGGFTLIELLIVVAIIAILAAIAIPQFSKYKQRGYKAALTSDIKNAYTSAMAYFTDNLTGTISESDLNDYGYQTSAGITVVTANMNGSGGGMIELKHSTYTEENNANINGLGDIQYY